VSRSYRMPYAVFGSAPSAHEDKKMAARGLRRRLKQWIHTLDGVRFRKRIAEYAKPVAEV
jgi:hypothetical protein